MTYICYRGIEISARIQYALLGIEVFTLVLFALFALVKVYFGGAPATHIKPSLSWLSPSGLSLTSIVTATLIAVFIYWGWDTAVATNEEADDPGNHTRPRRRALHRPAAADLRHRLDRSRVHRRRRLDRHRHRQPGQRGRRLRRHGQRRLRRRCRSARSWCSSSRSRVLTSASASTQTTILPTARTSLVHGRLRGDPEAVRADPPEVPDADRLDDLDGRGLDRVLRRADPGQPGHPGRHDRCSRA